MKTVLLIITTLLTISASGQNQNSCLDFIKKHETMEMFDVKRFNENKVYQYIKYVYLYSEDDGTEIEEYESAERYFRIIRPYKSAITIRKSYYKSGELSGISKMFYSQIWGPMEEFDKEGNLISSRDFLTYNFKFTLEDLVEKIKQDYGINILFKQPDVGVAIPTIDPPLYRVELSKQKRKFILINGITGALEKETDKNGVFGCPRPIEETAELVKENRTEKNFIINKRVNKDTIRQRDSVILETTKSKPKESWLDKFLG